MVTYTDLLPHQVEAVEKLKRLKVGALYMEMGTGKTRTSLEIIKLRLEADKIDKVIWLCPCSVKGDLLRGIREHSDLASIPGVLEICGIETLSSSVKAYSHLLQVVDCHRVQLIVDESSLVKNPFCIRSKHITTLAEKCPYKLILNGTPITKNEADLYSQWYILDWRILGYRSYYSFAANHLEFDKDRPRRVVRALNTNYLARKIEPYTYQCLKSEVISLPPKVVSSHGFSLTDEQDEVYEMCIQRLLTDLDDMSDAAIYRFFGTLQGVICGFNIHIDDKLKVSRSKMFHDPLANPRIQKLLEFLDEIGDDKAIIFCTYTEEIRDILQVLNEHSPGRAVPFYGEISQKKRDENIGHFRGSAQFLVANKSCGSFGLNLQFCHRIIYYSHDWNWGTRAQSEDRVHRIGQTDKVEITEIYAWCTLDEQILKCLSKKENLSDRFKDNVSKQSLLSMAKGEKYVESLSEAKCVRGDNGAV